MTPVRFGDLGGMYFCNIMKENTVVSAYSKFDLRRLWPVVSTTIYPETEKRVRNTCKDIRNLAGRDAIGADGEGLLVAMKDLLQLLEQHYKRVEELVGQRLGIQQAGAKKFSAGYFTNGCEQLSLSGAGIKSSWNKIHTLSRRCFGRSNSTADEKLALAKLNGIEQDILYILFVEQHYLCPLIVKGVV